MMKKLVILAILLCAGCKTAKIKNETYKIADSSPELGSIGQSSKRNGIENNFAVRTLPKLENNIRVSIDIVPFNNKLNKVYTAKAKYNQKQAKIEYIDSLPTKPELVTIKILDISSLVSELNAQYNRDVFRLLQDTEKSQIITSIAVILSSDEIAKIRQTDAYYLNNSLDKKYLIALYKSGKKTDIIDVDPETIAGYQTSKFCWALSSKRQWYIADLVTDNTNCKGNTKSTIPNNKNDKNLFDM